MRSYFYNHDKFNYVNYLVYLKLFIIKRLQRITIILFKMKPKIILNNISNVWMMNKLTQYFILYDSLGILISEKRVDENHYHNYQKSNKALS